MSEHHEAAKPVCTCDTPLSSPCPIHGFTGDGCAAKPVGKIDFNNFMDEWHKENEFTTADREKFEALWQKQFGAKPVGGVGVLLPCPFCGSTDLFTNFNHAEKWSINCRNCHCRTDDEVKILECISMWNTRSLLTDSRVEGLREALNKAAGTFRMYEKMNYAKGTVEGDEKAKANAALAKEMEAALTAKEGGEK